MASKRLDKQNVENVENPESVNVLTEFQEVTGKMTPEQNERAINELAVLMHVSPDTIRKLQTMTPEQAEKMSDYASKVKKGDKDKPAFMLTDIPVGTKIHLDELHPLKEFEGVIPHVKTAIRPLDRDNVESLKIAYRRDATLVPPLQLQGSTWGYIIVAGHHRDEAQQKGLREDREDGEGKLSEEATKLYKNDLATTEVNYVAVNAKTPKEVRDIAFFDNLTHGKSVNQESRTRYVIALMQEAQEAKTKFFMAPTCQAVGVSRQAVYQQISRDEKLAASLVKRSTADYTLLDETDRTAIEKAEVKNNGKEVPESKSNPLADATKKLIPLFVQMYNDCNTNNVTMVELTEYIKNQLANTAQFDAMQFVAQSMTKVEFTPKTKGV